MNEGEPMIFIKFSPHALRKKARCLAPKDLNVRVSKSAEEALNDHLNSVVDEIARVAVMLVQNDARATIQEKDVKTALLLIGGKR